jgi:hypothetical protein
MAGTRVYVGNLSNSAEAREVGGGRARGRRTRACGRTGAGAAAAAAAAAATAPHRAAWAIAEARSPASTPRPAPDPAQLEDAFGKYGRLIDVWVARRPGGFGASRGRREHWRAAAAGRSSCGGAA